MSTSRLLYCPLYPVHTIAVGKITTLDHELLDDPVESRPFITKALLPCAQSTEVLGGLRDCLPIETDDDSTQFFIPVRDIQIDLERSVNCNVSCGGKDSFVLCW